MSSTVFFAYPSFARWQHRRETSTPIVTAVRSRRRTVQLSSRHRHKVEVCAPLSYSTGGEANNSSNELLELGWGGQRSEGELTITRPNFGGSRPWFRCRGCSKRVAKLHRVAERWCCRSCGGLRYDSQRQRSPRRAAERAKRLRAHLGGHTHGARRLPLTRSGRRRSCPLWSASRCMRADTRSRRGLTTPVSRPIARTATWATPRAASPPDTGTYSPRRWPRRLRRERTASGPVRCEALLQGVLAGA